MLSPPLLQRLNPNWHRIPSKAIFVKSLVSVRGNTMGVRCIHSLSEVLASRYCCFRIAQVCREVSRLTDPFSCVRDIALRAAILPCHAALWESNAIPAQVPLASPRSSWGRGHPLCRGVWFCTCHAEESMSDHFCSLHQRQLQRLGGHKAIH